MARWAAAGIGAFILLAANGEAAEFEHVRSGEASIRVLLRNGYERSATFRMLVDDIDSRPGVVYVASTIRLSRHMDGALLHKLGGSPDVPILRVLIRTGIAGDYAIGILAHELQHVLEVLRAGSPADSAAMATLFGSLDDQTADSKFETEDARAITSLVLTELRANRR